VEEGRVDRSNPTALVFLYSGEEAPPELVALPQLDRQAAVIK
jgi:anaerobic magnesium-protoporphyrin IX monomethyl ester cyclase